MKEGKKWEKEEEWVDERKENTCENIEKEDKNLFQWWCKHGYGEKVLPKTLVSIGRAPKDWEEEGPRGAALHWGQASECQVD